MTEARVECERLEEVGYLNQQGEQLYYVLHPTPRVRLGRVLLAGPFAAERPHRHIPWTRWARYLASHGFEAMRFDYRGVGESTGRFEDMTLATWLEDIRFCWGWLRDRGGSDKVVLHGLGMGALLAAHAFAAGDGDALLMWLPPVGAKEMLYDQLKLRLAADYMNNPGQRKTRDQYVADLEAGNEVEVEGNQWTRHLWQSSAQFPWPPDSPAESGAKRPKHTAELDKVAAHMFGGVGSNPLRVPGKRHMRVLNPDLTECFAANVAWLGKAVTAQSG